MQRTIDQAQLALVSVEDDAFAEYSGLVQRLIVSLGPLADEDGPWLEPVRLLRGIRTRMTLWPGDAQAAVASMVLPSGWPESAIRELRAFSQENALLVAQAWECVERMGPSERELGRALKTLIAGLADVGRSRVLARSRFVAPTIEWLKGNTQRHPEVVSPSGLGQAVSLDRLIVIGPASWYPDHLRSVPRAAVTIVLSHSWVRDRSTSLSSLESLTGDSREIGPRVTTHTVGKATQRRELRIDADALLPGFTEADLGRMARRLLERDPVPGGARERDQVVEARMYVLASGEVVFLPTDSASRRDVAELSHEGITVARIPVGELQTGMYLLVRRSGASDYLEEMADRLLAADGEDPRALREAHSRWQRALREFVAPRGPTTAAVELRAAGVKVANASNVTRWTSGESLGLQKDAHFRALLRHLGLDDEVRSIMSMTRDLRNAHQRAGARLRQLLVARAEKMSPADLEAAGRIDVELEQEDGGTLMLARIEQVAGSTVMVPSGRIGIASVID